MACIPVLIITSIVFTKLLNKVFEAIKHERTKLHTFFAESIYGIKLIKVFNRQNEKQKECENLTTAYAKAAKPTGLLEGLLPASMTVIENLGITLIVWAVVFKVTGFNTDIGLTYVFITYLKNMFDPIDRMIENVEIVEEAVTSIEKIYEILEKEEYIEDFESGKIVDKLEGKIEFKNV